jgi:HSP20 family protein
LKILPTFWQALRLAKRRNDARLFTGEGGSKMANPIQLWNAFRGMENFSRDFDEVFDRFLGHRRRGEKEVQLEPAIESYVEDDKLVVRADLPGIDPKNVEIAVTGDLLTIKGSREQEREEKDRNFVVKEVSYGSFERSITLPPGVKAEDLKTSYKDGVLELTVPAPKELAARKVPVQVEAQKEVTASDTSAIVS